LRRLPSLLLLLALAAPAALRADASADLAQANAAWSAGQPQAALPLYERAHEAAPAWAAPLYGAALCQTELGQDGPALASLDEALRLDPNLAPARRLRAVALARLRRALSQPLVEAADLDQALGRLEAAERGYRLALQADPDCAEAYAGLARLRWKRGDGGGGWDALGAALRLAPTSVEALGLHNGMGLSQDRAGLVALSSDSRGRLEADLRAGPQISHAQTGSTDRDSLDGVFFAHLGWEDGAGPWGLGYNLMDVTSDVAGAVGSLVYQSLSGSWWASGRGRPGLALAVDEALETSQGPWIYRHDLVDLRWQGQPVGVWQPWAGLQALWEDYAAMAELNAFSPSAAMGVNGPLPWGGQGQGELRWRFDRTQDPGQQDHGASMHVAAQWRSGRNLSPRLDVDAKVQAYPQWPGSPGPRVDQVLDAHLEVQWWRYRRSTISTVVEAWRRASTAAGQAGQGSTAWVGGTLAW
jgi:Tfp pilus assembly protein PilF